MEYKLPKEWEWTTIGEIAKTTSGGTPSRSKPNYWGGEVPWLKSGELTDGLVYENSEFITQEGLAKSSAKVFSKGTLLLALYGATAGKLGILNFNASTNQAICAIKNDYGKFINEFLFYFLLGNRKKIIADSFGGAQPNISQTYIKAFPMPLPPLPEQKRIVKKLDAIFERIDKAIGLLEENIAATKELMDAVLGEVFGGLEKNGVELLQNVTNKIGSGSTPRGGQKSYKSEGISLIRSMNVHDSGFRNKGLAFIDNEQAKKLSNVTIEEEDVLLNITGASIARCCVVPKSILPARVNQHVCIIRVKKEKLKPGYLHFYLINPKLKNNLLWISGGGATREALTKVMVQNIEIPLPKLEIQDKVISYLEKIMEKINEVTLTQQQKLQSLHDLKTSLLDQAFKGEL